MNFRCLLLLLMFTIFPWLATPVQANQVAIIIDDLGYRKSDIEALSLSGNISYAVLPHTPFGQSLAKIAHQNQHDVILHIPMEAKNGKKLGPGALTSDMNEQQIRTTLSLALQEVPFAKGINNHMGSKLTELEQPMIWTMKYLKEQQLLFVDSMTSRYSLAKKVAAQHRVPTLHRHIFLDNQLEFSYIKRQFDKLIHASSQQQQVIAIAHPHPETITALKKLLPTLAKFNIDLVPISTLLTSPAQPDDVVTAED